MTAKAHIPSGPTSSLALAGVSVALFALRLVALTRVGFGDSEALYASYALHPQPAYLDHPGLIGAVARAIGGGTSPSPERAHLVTSVLATLVPWVMMLAARAFEPRHGERSPRVPFLRSFRRLPSASLP